jgi:hypothetical protein
LCSFFGSVTVVLALALVIINAVLSLHVAFVEDNPADACCFHADEDGNPGTYGEAAENGYGEVHLIWSCCGNVDPKAPGCTFRPHLSKEIMLSIRADANPSIKLGNIDMSLITALEISIFPGSAYDLQVKVTRSLISTIHRYFSIDENEVARISSDAYGESEHPSESGMADNHDLELFGTLDRPPPPRKSLVAEKASMAKAVKADNPALAARDRALEMLADDADENEVAYSPAPVPHINSDKKIAGGMLSKLRMPSLPKINFRKKAAPRDSLSVSSSSSDASAQLDARGPPVHCQWQWRRRQTFQPSPWQPRRRAEPWWQVQRLQRDKKACISIICVLETFAWM